MPLAILFHFLCTQHVSHINISIIRSLRLFCWITTLVVLFLVRCVLEFQASACNTDTTPTQPHRNSNTQRTKNNTTNVVIQQNSRKLLIMDILMSETYWVHKKWNKIASDIKLVFYSSTITKMHGPINIRFTSFFISFSDWQYSSYVNLNLCTSSYSIFAEFSTFKFFRPFLTIHYVIAGKYMCRSTSLSSKARHLRSYFGLTPILLHCSY